MQPWPQARGAPTAAETTLDPAFPYVDRDPNRASSDATYDPDLGQVRFVAIRRLDGDVYRTVPADRWAERQSVQLARVALDEFADDWLGQTALRAACDVSGRVWVVHPIVYDDEQRRTVRSAPPVSYDEVLETVPARVETTVYLGDDSFQFEHAVTVERSERVHSRRFW